MRTESCQSNIGFNLRFLLVEDVANADYKAVLILNSCCELKQLKFVQNY